ncbi:Sulfurtransferase TusE [Candidatus Arsenophonus lipoptenae]|uniref:Sulfurtransferase n=1 Tax=Candidatus Arsenophonus lipoptenae TaxID=634113 RepID=A0A0X9VMU0_9GAMM|nr:TusE/DsrC/DsvC family sulfur relay protein [Candidatus Arsenophonus lipoptenae]AMA65061.1 Sulfurtransferase TusE [Candidatus Arsenophonus lipoptenae]
MVIFKGREIKTDADGYLKNNKEWCEDLVYILAKEENIILTEEHWKIIRFIREFYLEFNTSPPIRLLIKEITKKYGKNIGNTHYLYFLFPKGLARQATKLAGLPKSINCI